MFIVNEKKKERQLLSINNWKTKTNCNGLILYPTGAGKTYLGVLAIQRMNSNKPEYVTHVVVPSLKLKTDWTGYFNGKGKDKKWVDGHIQIHGLKNVEVFVINTYIKTKHTCDLLVIDEVHRTGAKTFIKALTQTTKKFFMGLTATLNRLDGNHFLILQHTKIADTMTEEEAIREEFISEYRIFNLGITLTNDEKLRYSEIDKQFNSKWAFFDFNFDLAMNCAKTLNPQWDGVKWKHCEAVTYAISKGYQCEPLETIVSRYLNNKSKVLANKSIKKRADKEKVVKLYQSDSSNFYRPEMVNLMGIRFIHYMKLRKEFGYRLESKLDYLLEIQKAYLDKQIIVFSEDTFMADKVVEKLTPNICKAYHTNLNKTDKNLNISLFEEGKIQTLSTVRALNEGFNVNAIEITVRLAHTRSKIQNKQSRGRGNRIDYNNPDKCTIHINIFLDDFLDVTTGKLVNSHEKKAIINNLGNTNCIWVNSVQEIIDIMKDKNKIDEDSIILN